MDLHMGNCTFSRPTLHKSQKLQPRRRNDIILRFEQVISNAASYFKDITINSGRKEVFHNKVTSLAKEWAEKDCERMK